MGSRDLKSRLARFDRGGATATQLQPFESVGHVSRRPEAVLALGARSVGEGSGAYLRLEIEVGADRWPGAPRDCVSPEAWMRLGGGEPPAGERWAILDTETTGLQSGAGTLVFLVGLLHWSANGARLVQYLLPEPAAEQRLLEDLWADLGEVDALVSFNGRAFDRSRLVNRAILHRLDPRALDKPHLDLIHPARRVAVGWLPDCRLSSLEASLLAFRRENDLPGHEVPAAYLAWLHEGVEDGLLAVLDHNRMDVENLMSLAQRLSAFFEDGEDPMSLPADAHLALGRTLSARGRPLAARDRFAIALATGEGEVQRQALWWLGALAKRAREWSEADRLYVEGIRRWPQWIELRVERAKLQEHRLAELSAARQSVVDAMKLLERHEALGAARGDSREMRRALSHRLQRLQRRSRGRV